MAAGASKRRAARRASKALPRGRAIMMAMIRKQVQLTDRQVKALRREAARRGTSGSALVREAVEAWLGRRSAEPDRDVLWERAMAAVGIGHSGESDVAREHDRYLAKPGEDH